MAVYVHDSQFMTRRGTVLLVIVGLHAFIAWALATGLARRALEVIAPPIQTDIVEEVKAEKEPPPPPPPQFEKPPIDVPPPDVQIQMPVEAPPPTAITVTPTAPHAPTAAHATVRTPAGPGKGFPNTDDYYPPAARRLEEQGVVVVSVCVDPSGKLSAEPTLAQSSGSARLDEGAIKLAKAGSGHYKPATEDGKAVAGCNKFGIRFQLK